MVFQTLTEVKGWVKVRHESGVTGWVAGIYNIGRVVFLPFVVLMLAIMAATDPATRTFAARIAILDADAAVALGMTASVNFAQAGDEKIVVPLAAILQQGEQATVWVIGADAKVSSRVIEVERYADRGAVLKSGLQPGEQIVAAGAFKLVADETVRIAAELKK